MQTNNATLRRTKFNLLIFCSAFLLSCDLSFAQDQSRFQISPARQNLSDQNSSPAVQPLQDRRGPSPLSQNDLRGPSPDQQALDSLNPIQLPGEQSARNASSILQKSPEFPAMPPITSSENPRPRFDPAQFKLSPMQQADPSANQNLSQPARDMSTMSPESFREPNVDQGTIRTVSANLQDDGRNSALGTQPIGDRNQTQTLQQQGGFNPRPAQQQFGSQGNGTFQQNNPGNNSLQPQSPPAFNAQPTIQQPAKSGGLNLNMNSGGQTNQTPAAPRLGNNPMIGNGAPRTILPQTPPASTTPNTSVIKSLMMQYSTDNASQPLPGEPVAMQQMLELTAPQNRAAMVNQYWATYQAWCEYQCSSRYSSELALITPPANPAEKNLLNTAKSIAANELLAAEIQLTKAQSRLQKFMPNTEHDLVLPLPSDNPVVTGYKTHYDYYASRRTIPNEVRNIAMSLPKMQQLITQQAQTAQASQTSMDQIRQFTQGGRAPVSEALYAVRLWSDANKQVVRSVVDYNRSIAVYSMTIIGPGKTMDQLASALVSKPYQLSPTLNPAVRQATLPPEFQRGAVPNVPANNFNSSRQLSPANNGNFGGTPAGGNGQSFQSPSGGSQFNGGVQPMNGGSQFPRDPGNNFRGG